MPNPPSAGTWSPKATVPINAGSAGKAGLYRYPYAEGDR
jgi:hypothetical protein